MFNPGHRSTSRIAAVQLAIVLAVAAALVFAVLLAGSTGLITVPAFAVPPFAIDAP